MLVLAELSQRWDTAFDEILATAALAQSRSKNHNLLKCAGQDARIHMQRLYDTNASSLAGKAVYDAKHLGAWHSTYLSCDPDLNHRISAAHCNWKAFGKWWTSDAPFRVRLSFFRILVISALLSGLEPQCLTLHALDASLLASCLP